MGAGAVKHHREMERKMRRGDEESPHGMRSRAMINLEGCVFSEAVPCQEARRVDSFFSRQVS